MTVLVRELPETKQALLQWLEDEEEQGVSSILDVDLLLTEQGHLRTKIYRHESILCFETSGM